MDHSSPTRALISLDPWLEPYAHRIEERDARYRAARARIDEHGGLLGPLSQGHQYFGFNRGERDGKPGIWYREWAPAARALRLVGDFNDWDRRRHPLTRDEFGVWSIFLPDDSCGDRLVHGSRLKVRVVTERGAMDRIPAYARRVWQNPETEDFVAELWMPPNPYRFEHAVPPLNGGLRIYEAHIGMAQE